jgi:mono/diheme cytochrome c family protein
MLRYVSARLAGLLVPALAALALGMGSNLVFVPDADAQHKMTPDDMEVPIDDPKVVEQGREKFAERCSFCHGGGGKGGKGPCLTCGKFHYTGNTNMAIYTTIAAGITNRSLGGTMGAFGTSMSAEEILAVVTYLRSEERRRIASGEIPDPYKED